MRGKHLEKVLDFAEQTATDEEARHGDGEDDNVIPMTRHSREQRGDFCHVTFSSNNPNAGDEGERFVICVLVD